MDSITPQLPAPSPSPSCSPAHRARSHVTRLVHHILLLLVLHQLIGSEFMRFPFPGEAPSRTFSLHEYLGMANLAIVAAFWVWAIVRRGETRLGRLLPWFSIASLTEVLTDFSAQLRRLAHGRAPDDENGAFASAVHGLGLLAVTAMALSGLVFFIADGTSIARLALRLHKQIANLVWAYLFIHAGLAALHHLLGSDILSRMFWVSTRRHGGRRR
ncbi:MAG TPA: cytochrome b/b6 domain-containing protein [Stellaceae bacterium]|nr:cytochrome b/b6 domain-containing protein [Stellaceae bacterium]